MSDENKLDALIVKNIADIEAAMNRVSSHIDVQLRLVLKEKFSDFAKKSGVECGEGDEFHDSWIALPEWRDISTDDEDAPYDITLAFGCLKEAQHEYETWLSCFLNGSNNPIGIFVDRVRVGKNWKKIIKLGEFAEILQKMKARQFKFDDKKNNIWIEISIDPDKLAQAFNDGGDISDALDPITDALNVAMSAKGELNELVNLIRSVQ